MLVTSMIYVVLCIVSIAQAMSVVDTHYQNFGLNGNDMDYENLFEMLRRESKKHVPVLDGSPNNATKPVEGTPERCINGTYTPVAANCSMFLVCNEGNQTQGYCPSHLWFDPNHVGDMLCNYPEVVCAADANVCDCASKYPPQPVDPLIETDVTCLEDNRFHFNASRVECGRYFVCFNGHVRRLECKEGFHYDPKSESCDYPELVNCKIIDPDCPPQGVGFLPHPERKGAFYFCFHGYKTMQSCAFFHVWDEASNSCRRRDDMNMF